jgi:HD-GYP domain-containing protein (c-di-GMP phosphodiesterase class II)
MPLPETSATLSTLETPSLVLDGLATAREAMLDYEQHARARLQAANEQVLKARSLAQAAQQELADSRAQCQSLKSECAAILQQLQEIRDQLVEQGHRNKNLHAELLEVYKDLRAEDLPTLILRVGMNLVGAENGLFTGPGGEQTVAAIGLDGLPEPISQALYRFTREAAQKEDTVVCNDSNALPDGPALVNLAALPVSTQNDLRGVLLVANKRSGDFTEDDTELLLAIGRHAGIAMENQRLHCALADSFIGTVAVLADAIEAKDPYTRGHCEGVSDLAARVAERLGWDKAELDFIRYAALLHDVGKIGIPDGILLKPTSLSAEEFRMMQTHVSIGRDLVARVPTLLLVAPIVFHHHERWDGNGYPNQLAGEDIPLGARIVGAVDALDAMTTRRPYREAVNLHDATLELERCAGSQFDPRVIETLTQVLRERAPQAA